VALWERIALIGFTLISKKDDLRRLIVISGLSSEMAWDQISRLRADAVAPLECAIFPIGSMIFSREYVGYLARQTVKSLVEAKMIQTEKLKVVEERVTQGLIEELSLEDRINEEVRVILDAYQDDMRRSGASYMEMFKKVKNELARKYKAVL